LVPRERGRERWRERGRERGRESESERYREGESQPHRFQITVTGFITGLARARLRTNRPASGHIGPPWDS
jgi:hypothetical protein